MLLINVLLQLEEKFEEWDSIPEDFLKQRSNKKLLEIAVANNLTFLKDFFDQELVNTYLSVNYYEGNKYFSKESLEDFLDQLSVHIIFLFNNILVKKIKTKVQQISELERFSKKVFAVNGYVKKSASECGYLYDEFIKVILATSQKKVSKK
jgi:hypothetical protein